ncbi:GTP-binding protein REM 1-like [Saccostrea echinata]|uniref:GTP-binding protein REM 1-like n=1 Tax=Saccostrea echinata TaxID=191078 RepID=UPI002A7FA5C8|nr:GTP-binding protein REM 1-like [Saccostrea echinata]
MKKSRTVHNFLDYVHPEDFAASKFGNSLTVPRRSFRDQDIRRNSNISCGTSSSCMSESNDNFLDIYSQSLISSRCNSLTLSEIFHVSVLGDNDVGKHSLLHMFTDTEDIWGDMTESNTEDNEICVSLDGTETSLIFVEQITLENIRACAYMDVIVVMYSVVDVESFRYAGKIVGEINKHYRKPVILVANKVDLARKRAIFTKDGEKLANRFGCKYVELSLVLNHNVDDLLVGIVRQARLQPQSSTISQTSTISQSSTISQTSTEKQQNRVQKLTKGLLKRWRKLRPKGSLCTNLFDS